MMSKKRASTRHDPEVIKAALEVLRTGAPLRQTARDFGIPHSTLRDKYSGRTAIDERSRCILLTQDEEKKLVDHLINLSSQGFKKTKLQVRHLAKEILESRNGKSKSKTEIPSRRWVERFFAQYPVLVEHSKLTKKEESALVTPYHIFTWFSEFEKHLLSVDSNIIKDPYRIYCADDSIFAFDVKLKMMVSREKESIYVAPSNMKNQYWKKQVSILACMSASGHYLPPVMVYPKRDKPSKELLDQFPEALAQVSSNGWITIDIFNSWLKSCFIPSTEIIAKPILLLVDGHSSHNLTMETSEICESHGIMLYCLHPKSSHLIQPLNQAFFTTIKQEWAKAKDSYMMANIRDTVSVRTLAGVLAPVWAKAATVSNAAESFKTAGIYPYDPEKVMSSAKLAFNSKRYRINADLAMASLASNVTDNVLDHGPSMLISTEASKPLPLPTLKSLSRSSKSIVNAKNTQPEASTSTAKASNVTDNVLDHGPSMLIATEASKPLSLPTLKSLSRSSKSIVNAKNTQPEASTSTAKVTNTQLWPSASIANVTNTQSEASTSNAKVTNTQPGPSASIVTVTNTQPEASSSIANFRNTQPGPFSSNIATDVSNDSFLLLPDKIEQIEDDSPPLLLPTEMDHDYAMNSQRPSGTYEVKCLSNSIPSTSLAEDEDLSASMATLPSNDGPSSSHSVPSRSNGTPANVMDHSRLLALKNYSMFLYNEVSRNQFLSYFNKLSGRASDTEVEYPSKFVQFEQLASSLFDQPQGDNIVDPKVALGVDDILKLFTSFNNRFKSKSNNKKRKVESTNSTDALSEKFRAALIRKQKKKVLSLMKIEKQKERIRLRKEAMENERKKKTELAKQILEQVELKKNIRYNWITISKVYDRSNN